MTDQPPDIRGHREVTLPINNLEKYIHLQIHGHIDFCPSFVELCPSDPRLISLSLQLSFFTSNSFSFYRFIYTSTTPVVCIPIWKYLISSNLNMKDPTYYLFVAAPESQILEWAMYIKKNYIPTLFIQCYIDWFQSMYMHYWNDF